MTEAPIDISAVLVSYNTRKMTLRSLAAVRADLAGRSADVWLVDNASVDGTAAAVAERFPDVHVVPLDRNVGFGAGNNAALGRATGRYLLLVNTDAFPAPGATAAMAAYLDAHPAVGVVGPKLVNADGSLQPSCWRFPSPARAWLEATWVAGLFGVDHPAGDYRRWPHDAERSVDWVIGACLMVRRLVVEQVGGFDEAFFMYAEETDWQRRIRDAGWDVVLLPTAVVTHLGGASGTADQPGTRRAFFDSQDRYLRKHHGRTGLAAARAASVAGLAARLVAWSGFLVARPGRRRQTWGKLRFAGWLLVRQATHWSRS